MTYLGGCFFDGVSARFKGLTRSFKFRYVIFRRINPRHSALLRGVGLADGAELIVEIVSVQHVSFFYCRGPPGARVGFRDNIKRESVRETWRELNAFSAVGDLPGPVGTRHSNRERKESNALDFVQ